MPPCPPIKYKQSFLESLDYDDMMATLDLGIEDLKKWREYVELSAKDKKTIVDNIRNWFDMALEMHEEERELAGAGEDVVRFGSGKKYYVAYSLPWLEFEVEFEFVSV